MIDIAGNMIKVAHENVNRREGKEKVVISSMDAEKLDYNDGVFDYVVQTFGMCSLKVSYFLLVFLLLLFLFDNKCYVPFYSPYGVDTASIGWSQGNGASVQARWTRVTDRTWHVLLECH